MTSQPLLDLTGRVAVVTGATGQLGRTITRTLAACGADVAIHYHSNAEMAAALVREVESAGRRAVAIQADVTVADSVFTMRDAVQDALGAPTVIVNNAVIQYAWTSVLDQPISDYESQFRSCVLHNVLMAKAFVPGMIERGWGRVIGVNSECAMQCLPTQSAYAAGKRGMDGVLRVLAREVGQHGITVNQVAPGWTISDHDRAAGAEAQPAYSRNVPLRRRGTDQEIANVIAFLASDLASNITGAYIPICGGNVMPAI
ncbi:MAG TPA: SDR family oxidoreductase [Armatimonadota bacterium]|jgi:3-oxoacyl-[acyl-carrier protein] reductase